MRDNGIRLGWWTADFWSIGNIVRNGGQRREINIFVELDSRLVPRSVHDHGSGGIGIETDKIFLLDDYKL